jgi:hypothetical protein
MQVAGGYRYPSNWILLILSVLSITATAVIWRVQCLSPIRGTALLLGLEGTALLASAYCPVGLVPPQGSAWARFKWFLTAQKGTTVSFDPLMFFGGLLCLFLSFIISALAA